MASLALALPLVALELGPGRRGGEVWGQGAGSKRPPQTFVRFDEAVDHYLLEKGHQTARELVRRLLTTVSERASDCDDDAA